MPTPSLRTVLVVAEKREVLAAIRTLLLTIHRAEPYGPADILTPTTRYRLTAKGDGVRLMVGLRVDVVYHIGRVPLEMVNEARRRLVAPGGEARYGGLIALMAEFRGPPIRRVDDSASVLGFWAPAVSVSDLEDAIRRTRDALLKSRTPPAAPPRPPGAPNLTAEQARDALEGCIPGGVWSVDYIGWDPAGPASCAVWTVHNPGAHTFTIRSAFIGSAEPETRPDSDARCNEAPVSPKLKIGHANLSPDFVGWFESIDYDIRLDGGAVVEMRARKAPPPKSPAPPETCATEAPRDVATDPRVGDRVLMPPNCADYEVVELLPEFGVIVRHFKGAHTISRDGYNRAVWRGICRTPGAKVERGPG